MGEYRMKELEIKTLYEEGHSLASFAVFAYTYPWEVLPHIGEIILEVGKTLDGAEYDSPAEGIWIAKDAKIAPSATICPPCIIGHQTEVRTGAFIRGSALVGDCAVVGNSCELKNCILFDGVQVPHFNYVGDSILGYKAHLGAGAVTSNIKSDKTNVTLKMGDARIEIGMRKMGAMVGDLVEVGCNSVLCPGSVIGRETTVYPLSMVRGYVPERSIYKTGGKIEKKR